MYQSQGTAYLCLQEDGITISNTVYTWQTGEQQNDKLSLNWQMKQKSTKLYSTWNAFLPGNPYAKNELSALCINWLPKFLYHSEQYLQIETAI